MPATPKRVLNIPLLLSILKLHLFVSILAGHLRPTVVFFSPTYHYGLLQHLQEYHHRLEAGPPSFLVYLDHLLLYFLTRAGQAIAWSTVMIWLEELVRTPRETPITAPTTDTGHPTNVSTTAAAIFRNVLNAIPEEDKEHFMTLAFWFKYAVYILPSLVVAYLLYGLGLEEKTVLICAWVLDVAVFAPVVFFVVGWVGLLYKICESKLGFAGTGETHVREGGETLGH